MGKKGPKKGTPLGILLARPEVERDRKKVSLEADVVLVPEPQHTQSPSEPALYNLGLRLVVWENGDSLLDVRYSRLWGVDLADVKAMHQKLAAVDRAMSKMVRDFGYPADPADSFMRAVRAIGAEQVVETLDDAEKEVTGEVYRFLPLGQATDRLRRMLQEAVAQLPPAPAPSPEASPASPA